MTTFTTLVNPKQLNHYLAEHTDYLIFDVRFDLGIPEAGRRAYETAHITNAIYLDLDKHLSGPKTGFNGRHPLPNKQAFKELMNQLGMSANTQVICYDAHQGMFAARLWWMLAKWLGHEHCAVLDGGWQHWELLQLPITHPSHEAPVVPALPVHPNADTLKDTAIAQTQEIIDNLARQEFLLIDARLEARFKGLEEPIDPVAGHIPNAINRPFTRNLTATGSFKSPRQLADEFNELLLTHSTQQIVHQCGSGVTACHNLLAMEHAGLLNSRLYVGSWSEWCSDVKRPFVGFKTTD